VSRPHARIAERLAAATALHTPELLWRLAAGKEDNVPREMTAEEIRAFLSHGTRTAKLATSGPGGHPHVMPVWFALDGEDLVFTTWGESVKGRNLRRDPRAAVVVDDEVPPFAFVHIRGRVTLSEDLDELLRFATAIAARYVGPAALTSSGGAMQSRASCSYGSGRSV
jgi:PPOX class probable F420-dependent enzyme